MSFRCKSCHKARKGKPVKFVTGWREKVYFNEKGEQVGKGREATGEANICNNCDKARREAAAKQVTEN